MKELLRHSIRGLAWIPTRVCSAFPIDWVDGLNFHCLYTRHGYWLSLGLDFPPPQWKKEELKPKSVSLCIHNSKWQAVSENKSLFSRQMDFWKEGRDRWYYYGGVTYPSQALASGSVGLMWGLLLIFWVPLTPFPVEEYFHRILNYRLQFLPIFILVNPGAGGWMIKITY